MAETVQEITFIKKGTRLSLRNWCSFYFRKKRYRIPGFPVLFLFFAISFPVLPQSNYWPPMFAVPENEPPQDDSSYLNLSDQFSYYEILTNRNTINFQRTGNNHQLTQLSDFIFTYYNNETKIQSYDFSGKLLWPGYPFPADSFGIEWTPVASYKIREKSSSFHSMVDVGPVLKTNFKGIPVETRAGIAAYGWNDNIRGGLLGTDWEGYDSDPGYFCGVRLGDPSRPVGNLPLFINLQGIGKQIRNNGLGLIMGSVLYRNTLSSGDSIFIYAGDSLLNGKDVYLRTNLGSGVYQSSPWRIRHSLTASGGVRAAPRFGFAPAMYYLYGLNTVDYPKEPKSLNNLKNTSHTLNFQLSSLDYYFFDYIGGIEFTWGDLDKIYKNGNSSALLNAEELSAQINDYRYDKAFTDHELTIRLPENLSIDYELHASKDSRKYRVLKTILAKDGDTSNQDESDLIRIMHRAAFNADSLSYFSLSAWGEYARTYLYYFREMNSGNSKSKDEYRVGMDAAFEKGSIRFDERLFAESEITDFKFKHVHKNDPPPLTRKFSSTLSGCWKINQKLLTQISWNQIYYDNGEWYGAAYFDADSIERVDYYAIKKKNNDYSILALLRINLSIIDLTMASSFSNISQYVYQHSYDRYIAEDLRTIEPFMEFRFHNGCFAAQGKIGRIFSTLDGKKYNLRRNWDISLNAMVEFR